MGEIINTIVENKEELNYKPTGNITKVMIYSDRAKVTRKLEINIKNGKNTIVFENLPSSLDDSSININLSESLKKNVTILGTRSKDKVLTYFPREEERKLYNEIIKELFKLMSLLDKKNVSDVIQNLIEQLSTYTKDASHQVVMDKDSDIKKLSDTLDFLSKNRTLIHKTIYDIKVEKEDLEEKISILKKNLEHIRIPINNTLKNISIELDVKGLRENESISDNISISYLVPYVRWTTSYDIRLIEDENNKYIAKLNYYAQVVQKTGEDWESAEVLLTTAKPQTAQIPDIYPAYLTGHKKEKPKKTLVSGEAEIEEELEEAGAEKDEYESISPSTSERDDGTPQLSEVLDTTISKTFKLEGQHTIASDGNAHTLNIFEIELPVTLSYETIPKLAEFVYLKGQMKNTTKYPFLKGQVSIFRKNGYIGKSTMNFVSTNETFDLSFGIDENIKVRRIMLVDYLTKDKIGFNQHKQFGYNIEVKSFKDRTEEVVLKENIPVSELKQVKIKINKEKTTKNYSLNEKEGIIEWKFSISKGEKTHFNLYYEIEAPKSFNMNWI